MAATPPDVMIGAIPYLNNRPVRVGRFQKRPPALCFLRDMHAVRRLDPPRGVNETRVMNLELISIGTDTFPLDGIFYTPVDRPIRSVAMFFHGNCHNFYMGPSRFMPKTLV